jgi:hypothetical protein
LLAAASRQDISIISLAPFMASLAAAQAATAAVSAAAAQQLQEQAVLHQHYYQQHCPQHHLPGMAVPASPKSPARAGATAAGDAAALQQPTQQQLMLHHPSTAAVAVHSYRAPASVLSMQWTYDAAGLLLSDAAANIIMLQVKRKGRQQLQVSWEIHIQTL